MKWLQFILSHSIYIAICAVALTYQSSQLLLLPHDPFVYGFVFFSTLCSYNVYWILSKISFAKTEDVYRLLKTELTGFALLIGSSAGLLYCFSRSTLALDHVFTAVVLTAVYSVPLLPFKKLLFTRKAGVLKTILLAFTWAYVTAFIPMQKTYVLLDNADLFIITNRFLFMLILCIIFDNRDKAVDKIRGLHSLATDLSPVMVKMVIFIIFTALFISNLFYKDHGISFEESIALQVSTIALLFVYFYSAKKRSYLFYYFIVDGLMLFSAVATFIAGI